MNNTTPQSTADVKKHVEVGFSTIVMTSKPDRSQTFRQMVDVTDCTHCLWDEVVASAPKAVGEFEAIFVNLGRTVDCDKLESALASIGFELIVDIQGQAQVNFDNPEFAETHPNGTQWGEGPDRNYHCANFRLDEYKPCVYIHIHGAGSGWASRWWFPCRRINTQTVVTVV